MTARPPEARAKRRWLAAAIAVFTMLMAVKALGHVTPVAAALNHWYFYPGVFAAVAATAYFIARAYRQADTDDDPPTEA
jgi:hypothetical protein